MTTRQFPFRRWLLAGLLASATLGLAVRGQEPTPALKNTAGDSQTAAELRRLVKDLEAQAEMQRALLEKTEVSLLRAKVLLSGLAKPDGSKLANLRQQEERNLKRIEALQRVVRNTTDPALVQARRHLQQVRDQISELESR